MAIEFDTAGVVLSPDLHDGSFLGARLEGEDLLVLWFQDVESARVTLCLEGLEHLLINQFREGNIVLDMGIGILEAHIVDLVTELFAPARTTDNEVQCLVKDVIEQRKCIYYVSSSYGATLIAICRSVSHRP